MSCLVTKNSTIFDRSSHPPSVRSSGEWLVVDLDRLGRMRKMQENRTDLLQAHVLVNLENRTELLQTEVTESDQVLDWPEGHSLARRIFGRVLSGHLAVGPAHAGLQQLELGDVQHVEIQNGHQRVLVDLPEAVGLTHLREPGGDADSNVADQRIADLQFQQLIVDHAHALDVQRALDKLVGEVLDQVESQVLVGRHVGRVHLRQIDLDFLSVEVPADGTSNGLGQNARKCTLKSLKFQTDQGEDLKRKKLHIE